jgi:hypothetical protein
LAANHAQYQTSSIRSATGLPTITPVAANRLVA